MSGEHLSSATKALLRAAKADAPGNAARAKVWSSVTATVGGAAGASGAAGAGSAALGGASAAAGGMSAMKMLAIGTLLGGAVTVGLAATMLGIGPSPRDVPTASTTPVFAAANAATGPTALVGLERTDPPSANVIPVVMAAAPPAPPTATTGVSTVVHSPSHPRKAAHPAPAVVRPSPGGDALAREAALVADARAALARGDAQAALRTVRAARAMPSPQLVPEELAVEGQALRLLGSADEARGIDETLRTTYPESALAH